MNYSQNFDDELFTKLDKQNFDKLHVGFKGEPLREEDWEQRLA